MKKTDASMGRLTKKISYIKKSKKCSWSVISWMDE